MSHVGDGELHAYLDGALDDFPEARARAVREHLRVCRDCQRRLEDEADIRRQAQELLGSTASGGVELPAFEELRRLAAAADQPGVERGALDRSATAGGAATGSGLPDDVRSRRRFSETLPRRVIVAWAASLVLALGIGWFGSGARNTRYERSPVRAQGELATSTAPASAAQVAAAEPGALGQEARGERSRGASSAMEESAARDPSSGAQDALVQQAGAAGAESPSERESAALVDRMADATRAGIPTEEAFDAVAPTTPGPARAAEKVAEGAAVQTDPGPALALEGARADRDERPALAEAPMILDSVQPTERRAPRREMVAALAPAERDVAPAQAAFQRLAEQPAAAAPPEPEEFGVVDVLGALQRVTGEPGGPTLAVPGLPVVTVREGSGSDASDLEIVQRLPSGEPLVLLYRTTLEPGPAGRAAVRAPETPEAVAEATGEAGWSELVVQIGPRRLTARSAIPVDSLRALVRLLEAR